MKVFLAGATGAIGRPLTGALIRAGHEVLALARSEKAAVAVTSLGARPVRAGALDRDGLMRAVDGLAADAVVHQMTALKTPKRKLDANDPSNVLRVRGTANLLEAATILGAHRFLTQSIVLGYGYIDHGSRPLTEQDPFATTTSGVVAAVVEGLRSTEQQAFNANGIDGIAMRYGLFYGPGTWFDSTLGSRSIPVPVGGGGLMSWVHVEDAAAATVAALQRGRGGEAYNIVDDQPGTWGEVAEAAAAARNGRVIRVPGWMLRLIIPYLGALMVDTSIRVSHAKATQELGWTPMFASYRDGLARQAAGSGA